MRVPLNYSGIYTVSSLLDHIASASATVALCVKVTPVTGSVLGFTSTNADITGLTGHVGVTFRGSTGALASQLEAAGGVHASNLELETILGTAGITEAELNTPKWQGAVVAAFLLNYEAPTMGELHLPVSGGRLSDFKIKVPLTVTAEARGLNNALTQQVGRVTKPISDTELGDARCGLDIVALGFVHTGKAITTVTSTSVFRVASLIGVGADYFTNGKIEVETGSNAGLPAYEVKAFNNANGEFTLHRAVPYTLTTSDTVKATRGCLKTPAACAAFNNIANFRGFPFVPLEKALRVVEA